MIQIKNLDYKDILKNINLDISQNLTILGENGAGKSTLAKMICGLIPSESISIDNQSLSHSWHRAKIINYIPATFQIYDENVNMTEYLQSAYYKQAINHQAIKNIIKKFGLKEQMVATLSSGQKQLLQIALALLQDAKTTIFDEPTANLDPKNTKKVFQILKAQKQHQIIITHDLNLSYNLGYDILYLHEGQVKFFGTMEVFFKEDYYDGSIEITPFGVVVKL